VHYRGEDFLIEKGGEAVCRLTPVRVVARTARQLASVVASLPKPDAQFLKREQTATQGSQVTMGTLIDSSILVAAERGKLDLAERLASLGEDAVAIAARRL